MTLSPVTHGPPSTINPSAHPVTTAMSPAESLWRRYQTIASAPIATVRKAALKAQRRPSNWSIGLPCPGGRKSLETLSLDGCGRKSFCPAGRCLGCPRLPWSLPRNVSGWVIAFVRRCTRAGSNFHNTNPAASEPAVPPIKSHSNNLRRISGSQRQSATIIVRPASASAQPNTPICVSPRRARKATTSAALIILGSSSETCNRQSSAASQTRPREFFPNSPTTMSAGAPQAVASAAQVGSQSPAPTGELQRRTSANMGSAMSAGRMASSNFTESRMLDSSGAPEKSWTIFASEASTQNVSGRSGMPSFPRSISARV